MTSQEMMKAKLSAGQIFSNFAALGQDPDWKIIAKPADFDSAGDPNGPAYAPSMFGYPVAEFLAKQYK